MLGSILSVVDGARRPRRFWYSSAGLHVLAGMVTAAAWGAVLAYAVAPLMAAASERLLLSWSMLILALTFVPRMLGMTSFPPLLQSTWQVPQHWRSTQPTLIRALSYGAVLGPGLTTRILVPTYYILLLWSVVTPTSGVVVLVWSMYGATRGLPVLWQAMTAPIDSPSTAGLEWSMRLGGATTVMSRVNAMVLVGVSAFLGWSLWA